VRAIWQWDTRRGGAAKALISSFLHFSPPVLSVQCLNFNLITWWVALYSSYLILFRYFFVFLRGTLSDSFCFSLFSAVYLFHMMLVTSFFAV